MGSSEIRSGADEIGNPFPEGSKRAEEYTQQLADGSMSHAKARRIKRAERVRHGVPALAQLSV